MSKVVCLHVAERSLIEVPTACLHLASHFDQLSAITGV
jgi:hypothetical protein